MPKTNKNTHICEFCDKEFIRENSLIAHMCERKRRYLDKDNKWCKIALIAWQQFYKTTNVNKKKILTFDDFIASRYYTDFIKVGKFIDENYIANPEKYLDFVIKNGIKLSLWYQDSTYLKYVKFLVNKESPWNGIERSISYIQKWCDETGDKMNQFYKNINTNIFVNDIRNGKISPWLLYIGPNAQTLLNRLDNSQYKLMSTIIDPKVWQIKMRNNKSDVRILKQTLGDYGL